MERIDNHFGGRPDPHRATTNELLTLGEEATEAFRCLTDGLDIEGIRTFSSDVNMPLVVLRLSANRYEFGFMCDKIGGGCFYGVWVLDMAEEGLVAKTHYSFVGERIGNPTENAPLATEFLVNMAHSVRCGSYVTMPQDSRQRTEEEGEWWWLAHYRRSCVASSAPLPSTVRVSPTPLCLFGFRTQEDQSFAQKLLLTAPREELERFFESISFKVRSGEMAVIRHGPISWSAPSADNTAFVTRSAADPQS